MKPMTIQYCKSLEADLEKQTWTFQFDEDMTVQGGKFVVMNAEMYHQIQRMLNESALEFIQEISDANVKPKITDSFNDEMQAIRNAIRESQGFTYTGHDRSTYTGHDPNLTNYKPEWGPQGAPMSIIG